MAKILVADDEASMRQLLSLILKKEGHEIGLANDGREAWELFQKESWDLVIEDLRMPLLDGIGLLKKIKDTSPSVPVIVITAFSNWKNAVEAMRLGAFDYIRKPFDNRNIREVISRALESIQRGTKEEEPFVQRIVGNSPKLRHLLERVKEVAKTDATILIQGESGTGKELIASIIHYYSTRSQGPLIFVNCGSFTETLLESELFGHRKGAFTGANADKKGYLELAEGGTLVLDEIGEMDLSTQVKFLRVIENREFMPLGGNKPIRINIRFIGSTNRDLKEEVEKGRFRLDLFYRLNVIPLELPPLRERKEDIPLLVGHFLAKYSQKMGKNITRLSERALEILKKYDWPGNVRELENVIQRSVAFAQSDEIEEIELLGTSHPSQREVIIPPEGIDLEKILEDIEKKYIQEALNQTEGHITQAAKLLGISFRSLRYKLKKYNLS
ncbi:MAG: sigma-54-dependent Fis family transcriptional regulator [Planctomycetota bacterium]|nr:MAG: sigma-54-dependent Fis family transcriptional regulator [Planctomycetota bacterium]